MARRGRLAAWLLPPAAFAAVVAVAVVATGGPGRDRLAAGPSTTTPPTTTPGVTAPPATAASATTAPTTAAPTTTSTASTTAPSSASATTATPLPPPGNGALPQTTAVPSAQTAVFHGEMLRLWDAIRSDEPSLAMAAFFPQDAYAQVKDLSDDAADWQDRLVAHFELDVAAAHDLVGSGATFVGVEVPTDYTQWVPPGACYNRVGYWNVPGSRLLYRQGAEERSIGIASLISWRGYWYVVHLGSEVPPPGQGVVDAPAVGAGVPGPPGGC